MLHLHATGLLVDGAGPFQSQPVAVQEARLANKIKAKRQMRQLTAREICLRGRHRKGDGGIASFQALLMAGIEAHRGTDKRRETPRRPSLQMGLIAQPISILITRGCMTATVF
mgnify:CR=1 FL=1